MGSWLGGMDGEVFVLLKLEVGHREETIAGVVGKLSVWRAVPEGVAW